MCSLLIPLVNEFAGKHGIQGLHLQSAADNGGERRRRRRQEARCVETSLGGRVFHAAKLSN
jgi:hypothetical protein